MSALIWSFRRIAFAIFFIANASPSSAEERILPNNAGLNHVFIILANQIIQEGGYVDPSLQLASPAPCGADRGVILSKDTNIVDDINNINNNGHDQTSDSWLRIPFSYQLTRNLALETLAPLIPNQVLKEAPLVTLDDAALLVLLLVHLRGLTAKHDKWHPFLASLPDDPGCGWWSDDTAMTREFVIPNEIIQSSQQYVGRVSRGMSQDYGLYLESGHWPKEWKKDAALAIRWSLCIVSSRGTAASPTLGGGSVRLVPLADMFNHNSHHGGFIELEEKDNIGSREDVIGSFEIRRKDGTMPGDEITVDYNLDGYSPEDWFLSHGFVPSEVIAANNGGRSEL